MQWKEVTMVSLIERVWKQALLTFARNIPITSPIFEDNFTRLKSLADAVTAAEVRLDKCLLEWTANCVPPVNMRKPPVTYIEIYEDSAVTIGIFVLRSGARIPLHDHPQMHGILKVLTGTIKLQSYSVLPREEEEGIRQTYPIGRDAIVAEKLPELFVNEKDECCVLTPIEGNLHEINSVEGPAAFLDILAPPYDSDYYGERSCHYFKEISLREQFGLCGKDIVALYHIPSPPEFSCDSAPYAGPELRYIAMKRQCKVTEELLNCNIEANGTC